MLHRRAITLSAAVLALGLSGLAAHAQSTLRIVGNFAKEHPSSMAMLLFQSEVKRLTNDQIKVEIFDNMQLGGAKENVDGTRAGTVFATWVGMAFLSRTVPELEAVSLPFLFPSREAAFKVIDGPVGELLDRKLADKGFASLGFMELGSRQVTNSKRPIVTLDDFKGLKIRLQPNETHLATFRALGANAVAMDVKEIYSAMQQGVIDGQENPFINIQTSRYFEVQKYLTKSDHFFDFIAVVANKRQLEGLKPEFKAAVQTAMKTAIAQQRSVAAKADAEALEDLKKKGMEYNELTPAVIDQLRKATAGIVDELRKRLGNELIDSVLAEVKKAS
ncbi:MAG: C4-dicarboxylate ABC transporter substrate-binding protein [Rhizobiales bacterium PAR1]|nr:MAG: C4-dicarboxylate ABC transporter substrate-binding protein [Rhizobiales bacterium PAR1]